jgi:4-amino-4-deoxy-L-arabinose transferase-like glycosyltransferase
MALWDNDETTYAEIAREIWQTGDWITMHFRYQPWFCHPPLYFWSVALLDKLLGYTELAARLPAALFGAGTVAVVYQWGRRMLSPRAALYGALCLGLNFQFYTESRMALLDTMLHCFSFLALVGFWDGSHGRSHGWRLMFVASGLACLAKGPFGLVFPWLVGLPYLALSGRLGELRRVPWLWSLAALGIGGFWYAWEIARHGRPFFDTVLVYFAIKRMTVQVQGQGAPYWVYLAITAAGLFPWSVYLPGALWRLGRERSDAALMLLSCAIVPLVFFTIAETKLPNYIVFAYPAMALAIGHLLDVATPKQLVLPTFLATLVAAAFVSGLHWVWLSDKYPEYASAFPTAEAMCSIVAVGLAVALFRWKRPPAPAIAAAMALFLVGLSTFLAPLAEPFRPIKTLGLAARADLGPGDTLGMFGLTGEYGLTFYAQHYVTPLPSEQELRRLLNGPGKVLAVISQAAYASLSAAGGPPIHPVAVSGHALLVSNRPGVSVR